jgi:DNA helicase-2/ATP-dependent DNA helicase PcrA
MTLLGDFNQTVHPLKEPFGYEQISRIIMPENYAILELKKGYRSTSEIVDFTRSILKEDSIESIRRSGEKPRLLLVPDEEDLIDRLAADIRAMAEEGMKSIGIICKTAGKSKWVHEQLRSRIEADLLTRDDVNFSRGTIVLPVYLAKGLEFDGVILFDANQETYGLEQDRKLFYTACTRALHKLHLICCGKLPPFIEDIPGEYYETIQV